MEQYLIDTNVISDYFSSSFSGKSMEFMDKVIDAIPNLSVITQIELLSWKTDAETELNIEAFIADSIVLDIRSDVITKCVALRRKRKIKTPDAIISATALAHGFIIITNNEKDFSNIKGLKFINPHLL